MEALKSDDEKEREAATETLNTAAKAVGIDTAAFRNACEEIAYDPHTAFISEVWEEWRLGQEDAENGEQPAG